jgi:hypothetical protein
MLQLVRRACVELAYSRQFHVFGKKGAHVFAYLVAKWRDHVPLRLCLSACQTREP